ncbi:MAG: hypothetical protein LBK76_09860 [Verrucomicrobiales bacterium]|jgi:hypothetical protein|nr:hypothetical protein [Verrucomicrobiales bacterium]
MLDWLKICKEQLSAELAVDYPYQFALPLGTHDLDALAIHNITTRLNGDDYNAALWDVAWRTYIAFGAHTYMITSELLCRLNATKLANADLHPDSWPACGFALALPRGGFATDKQSGDLTGILIAAIDHNGSRNVVICGGCANGAALALHEPMDNLMCIAIDGVTAPRDSDTADTKIELGLMAGLAAKVCQHIAAHGIAVPMPPCDLPRDGVRATRKPGVIA